MGKNGQSAALPLSKRQLQVILSGVLGDGYIHKTNSNSTYFTTSCKYEEYIDYKKDLLGDLYKCKDYIKENGFCKTSVIVLRTKSIKELRAIRNYSIQEILDNLNELGIALWFYDDGSLHKKNLFYNLNTHSFSKETQEKYFLPFFNRLGVYPKLQIERKSDGREFWYLRIGKFSGANKITNILERFPIKCYSYKRWSSETIQKWSKFQEELKSTDIDFKLLSSQAQAALFKRLSM